MSNSLWWLFDLTLNVAVREASVINHRYLKAWGLHACPVLWAAVSKMLRCPNSSPCQVGDKVVFPSVEEKWCLLSQKRNISNKLQFKGPSVTTSPVYLCSQIKGVSPAGRGVSASERMWWSHAGPQWACIPCQNILHYKGAGCVLVMYRCLMFTPAVNYSELCFLPFESISVLYVSSTEMELMGTYTGRFVQ